VYRRNLSYITQAVPARPLIEQLNLHGGGGQVRHAGQASVRVAGGRVAARMAVLNEAATRSE
jgi:hypothetical protein